MRSGAGIELAARSVVRLVASAIAKLLEMANLAVPLRQAPSLVPVLAYRRRARVSPPRASAAPM